MMIHKVWKDRVRMRRSAQALMLLGLLFLVSPAFAQSDKTQRTGAGTSDWARVLDMAKSEGKVVVKLPSGSHARTAFDAFVKKYPEITLEAASMHSRDWFPRALMEREQGQYNWDVFIDGAGQLFTNKGLFEPLPRNLPETLPKVNDQKWYQGFDSAFKDDESRYFFGVQSYALYAVYINRDFVSEEALNSAEDLLKPEFRGKIVWDDPRKPGSGQQQAAMLLKSYGEEFLRDLLSKQKIVATKDRRQLNEWIIRGRYPIAIGLSPQRFLQFQEQGLGANVRPLVDPKAVHQATGSNTVALLKKAPHPNAAKVLINWFLSHEGQSNWAKFNGINSRRLDVPPSLPDLYPPDQEFDLVDLEKQEYRPYFKKAGEIAREVLQ
jgi:iron(III) transport system substrate-binding protein